MTQPKMAALKNFLLSTIQKSVAFLFFYLILIGFVADRMV